MVPSLLWLEAASSTLRGQGGFGMLLERFDHVAQVAKEGANKRGNSSRLTQSFHFFMFESIFSPVNALNQPI
ncbi:hypothetical protein D6Y99_21995 [Escherichia coli]|nr:hypothetical protein [Escherichia coli]